MDYPAHQSALLLHYVNLAQQDGWKQYTWQRVQQLSRDCPSLYADFPKLLTVAMNPAPTRPAESTNATSPRSGK